MPGRKGAPPRWPQPTMSLPSDHRNALDDCANAFAEVQEARRQARLTLVIARDRGAPLEAIAEASGLDLDTVRSILRREPRVEPEP